MQAAIFKKPLQKLKKIFVCFEMSSEAMLKLKYRVLLLLLIVQLASNYVFIHLYTNFMQYRLEMPQNKAKFR